MKLIISAGGIENFASRYPHMKVLLAVFLHFENMHVALSPIPTEGVKLSSRSGAKAICFDPIVKKVFFTICPLSLMNPIYDMAVCAQNIHRAHGMLSEADMYTREWILSDVLRFRPEEGTQHVRNTYFPDRSL
jgi:hypothetical protein